MKKNILAWPRSIKRLVVLCMDVALSLIATWLAFSLRLGELNWPTATQLQVYAIAPLLSAPVFIRLGLYRAIFRYTGQAALWTTAKAVAIYAVLLSSVLLWMKWSDVPRSLGILQPLIFLLLVGGSRALARFWLASSEQRFQGGRYVIYGAGMAGAQTAAALRISGQCRLIAFVDDDPAKVGHNINGVPIYAGAEIGELVAREAVTDVLLALPSVSRERRNRIIDGMRDLSAHVRTLPGMADLTSGRVTVQDFRELDIEDLLGRDPVPPDLHLLKRDLTGKVILVTGAGGSIGSELCRQIVRQAPRRLVLMDHAEYSLYAIEQELEQIAAREGLVGVELVPVLGSVTNGDLVTRIFISHRPDTVYHAAAYKHVPLVEANPLEGLSNNVFGTLRLVEAARTCGASRFVLVSTDKAVRPTNVMGASKRLSELILQAWAMERAVGTCFCIVRFGNVLGSSGSVVPLFRRQLAQGGPLTVTHQDVTRYFMTIPEAAQLVLQAGAMAHGGEVFLLEMGEPVRIMDLARRMIELSGMRVKDALQPEGDIEIQITGLRPGEKLYEELLIGENPASTDHPRILKAREAGLSWRELNSHLLALQQAIDGADVESATAVLRSCVTGFTSSKALHRQMMAETTEQEAAGRGFVSS